MSALLASPAAWAAAAAFTLLVSGFGFIPSVVTGQMATMDGAVALITNFLVFALVPLLTTGVLTRSKDARNQGWEVVAGAWLAAFAFYALLLAITLGYVAVLRAFSAFDLGLVAATYLGLMLVGAAAIAVGVLVSSLVRNRALAFAVTVAGLLAVWYLGPALALLAPTAGQAVAYVAGYDRLQSFRLGQASLRDVVYFVTIAAAALLLAGLIFRVRGWRWRRTAATAALVAMVAANIAVASSAQALDLTQAGNNTLTAQSVLAANRLAADLQVIGLFRPGANNGQPEAEALVALYQAQSSHVQYRASNPDADAADVKRYGVTEVNTLVLAYAGKSQLLLQGSQSERNLTTAILNLEATKVPMVCWAIGDGERALTDTNQSTGYSGVANLLSSNDFAHRDVFLGQLTAIPTDCDELAIMDPTSPLPEQTVKMVGAYLAGGGKLLAAAEPWAQNPQATASLSAVLSPYGLAFSGALVLEGEASRRATDDPTTPAAVAYGHSPITADVQGAVSYFPRSTAIAGTPTGVAAVVHLVATSAASYAIAQVRSDLARHTGDVAGPFTIMETLEQPAAAGKTRIVMVGTQAFAENRTLPPISSDVNVELALASFQWLAGQDSLVLLPAKPGRALPLALTSQDQTVIVLITGVLMPALVVLGGVAVWWRRRVAR
jgi:ABC-2 type transport system permease protein